MVFCAMALMWVSCSVDDEQGGLPLLPEDNSASYVVPVEEALQRLNLALERIDGGTRAGRIRSVQSVDRVKASRVMDLTRSAPIR